MLHIGTPAPRFFGRVFSITEVQGRAGHGSLPLGAPEGLPWAGKDASADSFRQERHARVPLTSPPHGHSRAGQGSRGAGGGETGHSEFAAAAAQCSPSESTDDADEDRKDEVVVSRMGPARRVGHVLAGPQQQYGRDDRKLAGDDQI